MRAERIGVRLGPRQVLTGVSAEFRPSEVTAILGPNGAGKSTLLACLAGLRSPDQGQVWLGPDPILSMPPRLRAQKLGFIPQSPEVAWALEVEILVGLGRTPHIGARGLSREDGEAVSRAMVAAGIEDLAGRDVTTLSGGERARVLIARALAGEPDWLLADEPLTGLDPGHQLDVAALFRAMAHDQGKGVIVTLHDLTLAARMADRILVLWDGGVLSDGLPERALSAEVLAQAYGIEARLTSTEAGLTIEILGRTA